MFEEWAPIQGFDGFYSVSNMGRIRSERRVITKSSGVNHSVRQRIMAPARKASGHLSVMLYGSGGRNARIHVHRAVALAFLGSPPTDKHEVAHNDGNPANNTAANLRWATRAENHADKVGHGTHNRGERHPLHKLTDQQARDIRASSMKAADIAAAYSISPQHAWAVKTGVRRSS